MRAADVMTVNVITVTPDTSIHDLAEQLSRHGISGMPVMGPDGELLGIVSESDLLHRAEVGTLRRTQRQRSRWFDLFGSETGPARDYVKAHGRTVGDIMSLDVISVAEDAGLDEVADLMETQRIKRVPVMRDGKMVGIISRANLVRALAMLRTDAPPPAPRDDQAIRLALLAELRDQKWARVWAADVTVKDGTVHLWCGDDQSEDERRALRVAAENIAGVRGVEEHLVHVPTAPPM